MDLHHTSKKIVGSIAALLLFGAAIVVTQPFEAPVTPTTLCVNRNGQLRMPTGGGTNCGPSEQPVRWVVGGEVTDVRVGDGLVASRKDGIVDLALDPSILECANCGPQVFAGFHDGPGAIPPGALPTVGDPPDYEPQPIATLDVPRGDYAIFAKLLLVNDDPYGAFVRCKLAAGVDSDAAYVVLEEPTPAFPGSWGGASADVMNLQVVHRFDTAGVVVLSCADGFPVPFVEQPADGPAQFRHLKITAMKVASISNVVLGQ